jgi:CRP-like cAMP-binding protein
MTAVSLNLRQQVFSHRDLIPLQPNSLWRIERGVVRPLTWTETGTPVTLGYWGAGDVVGQPLSRISLYQIECLTSAEVSTTQGENNDSSSTDPRSPGS